MHIACALFPIVLATAASAAPPAAPDTVETVRRAIEAGNAAWADGMKRADVAPIVATFDPEGINVGPNGVSQKGPAEISKYFGDFLAGSGPAVSTDVRVGEVHLDGNLAYEWGRSDFRFQPKGKAPLVRAGRYLAVWRKQSDGSWKLYRNLGLD